MPSPSPNAEDTTPPVLPEGYYLANVTTVLDTVLTRYGDLLDENEHSFAATLASLDEGARRLWVRLISRKGPCFRRDRLGYPEIADLDGARLALEAAGFADRGEAEAPAVLLDLLRRDELAALRRAFETRAPASARKDAWIADLVEAHPAEALCAAVRTRVSVLRPHHADLLRRFRLLFFGNLSQDWSAFVLRDLGLTRYEAYDLDPALRRFPTRQAMDDVLELLDRRAVVAATLYEGDLEAALEAAAAVATRARSWHPRAHRLVDGIANRIGRALERASRHDEALRWLRLAESPPARERRARIHLARGDLDRARALCEAMATAPRDETERDVAPRLAHRIARQQGQVKGHRPRRRRPSETIVVEHADAPVEALALEALAARGQPGFFAENWLWRGLFGLAFWDIVFAPVPGAFEHPFQGRPLDLFHVDFRANRAEAIEARLAALRADASPAAALLAVFDAKHGLANALVSWHDGARDGFAFALERLTGADLAWISDRLSRDLRRYRNGFPDLFVAREEAPGWMLFEVKGPGDQLRAEQRGWLDHFADGGLPAAVLDVRWQ